jgi:thiosulfate/3-mercaptopyruvate sulfurtransferase
MSKDTVSASIAQKGYAHPDRLVSTEWLAEHLNDPTLRILESDEDVLLFDMGHISNAQKIDWHTDLNDRIQRDYVAPAAFEALLRARGIDETTTVILYGDKNNWWATYALWVFEMKWEAEGRPMVTEVPSLPATSYRAPMRNDSAIRSFFHDVLAHLGNGILVDVRSPQEYTGERTHMPDYPQEGTLRGGHIPTARSIPWAKAANADGSFKSADELRTLYEGENGLTPEDDVITYCRIGERSSHSWFVLTYLLGYKNVKNYDGSWTEWGNAVRSPINVGTEP